MWLWRLSSAAAVLLVVGAGIVGLTLARELNKRFPQASIVVLEKESGVGKHASGRNSGVLHAGMYYAPGSLKARLCVAGRQALYRYCAEHGVKHRRLGKLIVATDESQVAGLQQYQAQAEVNGVTDLRRLEPQELRELEPRVACIAGVLSPSTGIVDSHGLMLAYLGDAQLHGAALALASPVRSGRIEGDGVVLEAGGAEPMTIRCRTVVNAAGLGAQSVARSIAGVPARTIPPAYYAIGHYYTLSGAAPFGRLIYPVARQDWLGVHVTIDLGGQVKFGPDFGWIDRVDYRFDESREAAFYAAIRRYFPELRDGTLRPGYTGIRPKLAGPGAAAQDFVIQGVREHGVPGLVSLYGIESPGLTASLAIADHVAALLAA